MNFLETPTRRKVLFASLYFSEGAPIGFLWLALTTRLETIGFPIERIAEFAALLVIPWTFKFAWAPLVDLLRSRWWTLRHWIIAAQSLMGLTLLPLLFLDLKTHFPTITAFLLLHAFAAATQDVAIDALCISVTDPLERGKYNGWMQAGMLIGRACLGGGALVMAGLIGWDAVIVLLVFCTTVSGGMVWLSVLPEQPAETSVERHSRWKVVVLHAAAALRERNTWFGLAFALTSGAAFKSLDVIIGAFLKSRGFSEEEVGWFTAGPVILSMVAGALVGGRLADRTHRIRAVALSLVWIVAAIAAVSIVDLLTHEEGDTLLMIPLAVNAFGVGLFTASSYALFMDLTKPELAATQFSAFMGTTNGCESWSVFVLGQIVAESGYAAGLLAMCGVSLMSLVFLGGLRISRAENARGDEGGQALEKE